MIEDKSKSHSLDGIAEGHGFDKFLSKEVAQHFATMALRAAVGKSWLEMGPAEGWGTEIISRRNPALHLLEGSGLLASQLQKTFTNSTVHQAMFEDFQPAIKYDTIFASHVLEHVDDPMFVLDRARSWLRDSTSRIIVSTPNSESIHRSLGVSIGALRDKKELTDSDKTVGHQRVFDQVELSCLLTACGYSIVIRSGFFLKPLSAFQLMKLSKEDLGLLFQAGELYPEISADLFIVAERG